MRGRPLDERTEKCGAGADGHQVVGAAGEPCAHPVLEAKRPDDLPRGDVLLHLPEQIRFDVLARVAGPRRARGDETRTQERERKDEQGDEREPPLQCEQDDGSEDHVNRWEESPWHGGHDGVLDGGKVGREMRRDRLVIVAGVGRRETMHVFHAFRDGDRAGSCCTAARRGNRGPGPLRSR